jgi:predicted nuclease of predicted toxin-antitoxin system
MRFVVDEGCDIAVAQALRSAGHDVVAVAEIAPRAADDRVLKFALDDRRILITEDKDFGELVFAQGQKNNGVILKISRRSPPSNDPSRP